MHYDDYCQCHRQNPDVDGRQIDRQLQADFLNPELRLKMLNAKYRAGKLSLDNILLQLAGFLGDLTVRQFTAEVGLKETWGTLARPERFPKLLFKKLINLHPQALTPLSLVSVAEHPDQIHRRLVLIAGLTAFLMPILEMHIPPLEGSQVPSGGVAVDYLRGFVTTLQIPSVGISYDQDWTPSYLFWALRSILYSAPQQNVWLGYLESSGDILANYSKEDIYRYYQQLLDQHLYSWDVELPSNIPLLTYLQNQT